MWHELLSQFNLVVIYVLVFTQKIAHPLSRAPWYYRGKPDEGHATFHGPPEAEKIAHCCDAAENILDSFPVNYVLISSIWTATNRRRKGRKPGPRKILRTETPSTFFFANGIIHTILCMVRLWTTFDKAEQLPTTSFQSCEYAITLTNFGKSVCPETFSGSYYKFTRIMDTLEHQSFCPR